MNREILFRGKQLDTGTWIESDIAFKTDDGEDKRGFVVVGFDYNGINQPYNFYTLEVDPATISQFTGLIDKNGVKIFDGDILGIEFTQQRISDGIIQNRKYAGVISFGAYLPNECEDRNSYSWLLDGTPISNEDIDGYDGNNCYWKIIKGDMAHRVIGNIWDNPELVKNKNNYKSIDGIGEFKVDANEQITMPDIYIVHAKRWGNDENHSYIVTATLNKADALSAAETEEIERGGKYGCEVISFNCGEKAVIRKPYDDKSVCFNCEFYFQRTGLICQQCMNFNNWSKKE